MPWQQAYQNCATGEVYCEPFATGTIYLARATVTNAFGDIQPDNSVKWRIVDRLVYALIYDPNECSRFGPPAGPGTPDDPLTFPCTTVSWIDAGTGKGLGAQGWGPGKVS